MYLEISPRQVGKTTRLIEAVKKSIQETGKDAAVFVCNLNMVSRFRTMSGLEFFKKDEAKNIKMFTPNSIELISYNLNDYNLFFDEFDFFEPKNDFWGSLLPYTDGFKNSYFCTTPSKLRKLKNVLSKKEKIDEDILVYLLQHNLYHYEKVELSKERLMDFSTFLSKEHLLMEGYGVFAI